MNASTAAVHREHCQVLLLLTFCCYIFRFKFINLIKLFFKLFVSQSITIITIIFICYTSMLRRCTAFLCLLFSVFENS